MLPLVSSSRMTGRGLALTTVNLETSNGTDMVVLLWVMDMNLGVGSGFGGPNGTFGTWLLADSREAQRKPCNVKASRIPEDGTGGQTTEASTRQKGCASNLDELHLLSPSDFVLLQVDH